MEKIVVFLFLLNVLIVNTSAQNQNRNKLSESERRAIEDCLKHYFAAGDKSDPSELSRAFYTGAMMFWADAKGEMNYITQRGWKAILKENKNPVKALRRDIQSIDCTKDVCIAKIVSTFTDRIYHDYMAMVKTGEDWKIVSKIYLRTEPKAATITNEADDKQQIERLLQTKFKAMDTNDADLLSSAYYPRAMSYYTDENQLVGVSIGEWIARFAFDKKNNTPASKATRKIQQIDSVGSVGYARFTHEFSNVLVTDYVLLLKTENVWRIINLLITTEEKN